MAISRQKKDAPVADKKSVSLKKSKISCIVALAIMSRKRFAQSAVKRKLLMKIVRMVQFA